MSTDDADKQPAQLRKWPLNSSKPTSSLSNTTKTRKWSICVGNNKKIRKKNQSERTLIEVGKKQAMIQNKLTQKEEELRRSKEESKSKDDHLHSMGEELEEARKKML